MPPPERLLFIRPDTYGDLVLFEPALRLVREAWPQTEVAVLIREPYADLAPLMPAGVRWLTTRCNPYRLGPRDCREEIEALRETVLGFAPDWLVAGCFEQSWLDWAVASILPKARQIRAGGPPLGAISRAALEIEPWFTHKGLFPEEVAMDKDLPEREKNLRLAAFLLGRETEPAVPRLAIPADARAKADAILAQEGLTRGEFIACAAGGAANVTIKAWPARAYAETLAWLEAEHGRRSLLTGHVSERELLESVASAARELGAHPALWLGEDGSIPALGGLLDAAGAYFGNDTGALHMAAALGRPAAAIFGGGTWPRFKPAAVRAAIVVQPLPCFGCGWHCLFGDAPCVKEIPAAQVRDALEWLLEAVNAPGEREFDANILPPAAHALIASAAATARSCANGASQADLSALLRQLDASEADRIERLGVIESQGSEISRLQAEAHRWEQEAASLWPRLNEAINGRNLAEATLANSEQDRAARQEVIARQGSEMSLLHAQVDHWLRQAGELQTRAETLKNERNYLTFQVKDLEGHFAESEADRAARLVVIQNQAAVIERLEEELRQRDRRAGELAAELDAGRQERDRLAASLGASLASANEALAANGQRAQTAEDALAAATLRHERIDRHWTVRLLRKLSLWID